MAVFTPRFLRHLRDVLISTPADGEVLTYDTADSKWKPAAGGGGGLTFPQILAALAAEGWTFDAATGQVSFAPTDSTLPFLTEIVAPTGFQDDSPFPGGYFARWVAEDGTVVWSFDTYSDALATSPAGNAPVAWHFLSVDYPDTYVQLRGYRPGVPGVPQTVFSIFDGAAVVVDIDSEGRVQLPGNVRILTGAGSPESVVEANVGSLYLRNDGGAGTAVYRKESGVGDTGWVAVSQTPAAHAHAGEDITSGTVADARIDAAIARDAEVTAAVAAEAATRSAADATLQPLDATLTNYAGLAIAANKLAYGSGADAHSLTDFTAAARALLDDADAAAMLTTLGLSAFVKTLMDDADASAFLTTLGVSTFIKTMLDDADADAALNTLGVHDQTGLLVRGLGLQTWAFDPANLSGTSVLADGSVHSAAVGLRKGQTVTGVVCIIGATSTGITACKVGLVDTAGTRLAISADLGTTWQTTGLKQNAFTGGALTVPASGLYYLCAFAKTGTTMPSLRRANNSSGDLDILAGGANPKRYARMTGQTDIPTTVSFGTQEPTAFWLAAY